MVIVLQVYQQTSNTALLHANCMNFVYYSYLLGHAYKKALPHALLLSSHICGIKSLFIDCANVNAATSVHSTATCLIGVSLSWL
jgi:hypothetical protein